MDVTVTPFNGPDYAWAGANWAWNDPKSQVTWAASHQVTYDAQVTEALVASDSLEGGVTKHISETLTATESSYDNQISQNISELVAVAEGFSRIVLFYQNIAESLGLGDNLSEVPPHNAAEALTILEDLTHAISQNSNEILSLSELLAKDSSQFLSETITFADSEKKTYEMSMQEALHFIETYVRKANAVFSNMVVNTGDLTLAAFNDLVDNGKVVGYERFREFIPGDHTYQKAMFRAILESVNSDRGRLNQMTVEVDASDVFDRGSATIDASHAVAGLRINFTRSFHIVPEITITLKGGTVIAVPCVLSPDATGFTVFLKDPATENGVQGTITWAAHGY